MATGTPPAPPFDGPAARARSFTVVRLSSELLADATGTVPLPPTDIAQLLSLLATALHQIGHGPMMRESAPPGDGTGRPVDAHARRRWPPSAASGESDTGDEAAAD